ncbi:hybrid sensor histidine kinase/response regulator [Amaricoccus macauensis]|uniref:hybrid sensor histidine kinase/response regulator n=1 Tax=Amaricoccus macauensis TaxID=57001 RepID=UPI003C7E5F78
MNDQSLRRGLGAFSHLPTLAAVAVVFGIGLIAEVKTRELSRQIQREEAADYLDGLRLQFDEVATSRVGLLKQLSGTLLPDDLAEDWDLNGALTSGGGIGRHVLGMAAISLSDGRLFTTGLVPDSTRLLELFNPDEPERHGATHLPETEPRAIAVWGPVYGGEEPDGGGVRGQAAILVDSEAFFSDAGLRDVSGPYQVALTQRLAADQNELRGVLLGNGGLGKDDPVRTEVFMPGGNWTLEIAPENGWTGSIGDILPVRLLTLISVCAVALMIFRMRQLSEERRRNLVAMEAKEREINRTAERLELALSGAQIGVFDYNATTDKGLWDETMCRFYGADPRREKTMEAFSEFLHPEDREETLARVKDAIRSSAMKEATFRVIDSRGRLRYLRNKAKSTTRENGDVHLLGVCWDETEVVERDLELERRREHIEAATEARSRLFATLSHEIRTPLGGILGVLDLMRQGELSPEQRGRADLLHSSANQLMSIVTDSLYLSKLQSDEVTFQSEAIDIREMAAEVITLMSATSQGQRLRMTWSATESVPRHICGDAVRFRQIFNNIVGNAVRYTDEGSVLLNLDYDADGPGILCVTVTDTGIGIAPEQLPAIFGRFTQCRDLDERHRGGSGLGLAICKEITDRMGGEIFVESLPGEGTTFRLRIPAPEASRREMAEPLSGLDGIGPAGVPRGKTAGPFAGFDCVGPAEVLEGAVRPTMPAAMDSLRGGRVLAAMERGNGMRLLSDYCSKRSVELDVVQTRSAVMEALLSDAPDLLLLDLDQGQSEFIATARRMRQSGTSFAGVPIIALTGGLSTEAEKAAREAGIEWLLAKPLSQNALHETVVHALEGTGASGDSLMSGVEPSSEGAFEDIAIRPTARA